MSREGGGGGGRVRRGDPGMRVEGVREYARDTAEEGGPATGGGKASGVRDYGKEGWGEVSRGPGKEGRGRSQEGEGR